MSSSYGYGVETQCGWLGRWCFCYIAAPWVQLSVSVGNGWPHNALRHHWLMPISCHFRDRKALLVTSLAHVNGAVASVHTFTFTFTVKQVVWLARRRQWWRQPAWHVWLTAFRNILWTMKEKKSRSFFGLQCIDQSLWICMGKYCDKVCPSVWPAEYPNRMRGRWKYRTGKCGTKFARLENAWLEMKDLENDGDKLCENESQICTEPGLGHWRGIFLCYTHVRVNSKYVCEVTRTCVKYMLKMFT